MSKALVVLVGALFAGFSAGSAGGFRAFVLTFVTVFAVSGLLELVVAARRNAQNVVFVDRRSKARSPFASREDRPITDAEAREAREALRAMAMSPHPKKRAS